MCFFESAQFGQIYGVAAVFLCFVGKQLTLLAGCMVVMKYPPYIPFWKSLSFSHSVHVLFVIHFGNQTWLEHMAQFDDFPGNLHLLRDFPSQL